MKLIITTEDIHIEYSDDVAYLQEDVKKRIVDIVQTLQIGTPPKIINHDTTRLVHR